MRGWIGQWGWAQWRARGERTQGEGRKRADVQGGVIREKALRGIAPRAGTRRGASRGGAQGEGAVNVI